MVLYRKYRPQNLEELTGQTAVKIALSSAIKAGKLAHAYLFCGPKGTGKTSTARILAKIVNCQASNPPCGQCESCLAITAGTSLDVVEMDAASNRGIEDIRSLRENIKLAPSNAKKKVYIIDEVHMLTGDAFNALLKTLEEPPEHVLFILATTEVQKIPATIMSRIQRLDFKPASTDEVISALRKVVEGEKITIEETALLDLAKKAQGSFRDGIKYLDQLSALGKIDSSIVEQQLGSSSVEVRVKLLNSIATKDSSQALQLLNSVLESGLNPKEFNISLLDTLRYLLYIQQNLGTQLVKSQVSEEEFTQLTKLAADFSTEQLIEVLNNFQTSLEQARFATIASLPLEVAIVQSCLVKVEQSIPKTEKLEVSKDTDKVDTAENELEAVSQNGMNKTDLAVEIAEETPVQKDKVASDDIKKIQDKWAYILETVRQYNFSLEALLRTSQLSECNEKNVVIEVPYSFHQRIIEAPKSRELLESVFGDILGRKVKVATELGKRQVKREELANVEIAADDEIVRIAAEIFNNDGVN
ncbi:MAG: DNA polymerase III subunit gamma/tau [Patescibacteria group bacterium]|nr:DNA polymerase III subunit gamma/tau [Patescibacteria group bacterium]